MMAPNSSTSIQRLCSRRTHDRSEGPPRRKSPDDRFAKNVFPRLEGSGLRIALLCSHEQPYLVHRCAQKIEPWAQTIVAATVPAAGTMKCGGGQASHPLLAAPANRRDIRCAARCSSSGRDSLDDRSSHQGRKSFSRRGYYQLQSPFPRKPYFSWGGNRRKG